MAAAAAALPMALTPIAHAAGPGEGSGGPILVVADPADPYGRYYAEILRAEGLNAFAVTNVGALSDAVLAPYQVVLLAQAGVSAAQASMLSSWVQGGGNLIAMRPGAPLASTLGLGQDAGDLDDAYLKIDTASAPGAGITGDPMQFHGRADRWSLAGARAVATLYASPGTPTSSPAVTLRSVGSAGGEAAAFTYDLARSVVQTRQGNPAFAGQKRDGQTGPIRSDDLFFPTWLDFGKVAIPQADEQQRLLANLITDMARDRLPLPRFWYLPRGEKAAVVMTGDDHGNGGTAGRLDHFAALSPAGCSVADWHCVRATSYVYPTTPMTDAQVAAFQQQGFEVALHLSTACVDFTPASLEAAWVAQLAQLRAAWPSIAAPRTNRTHCIAWSTWAGEPRAELAHGVRFDTNYYYWPASWIQNRPGLFTGAGFPMRFADVDGSLIDVYQAPTQLTDESGIDIPTHIRALIDGALGSDGYYGVFTANMHTDAAASPGADAIVAEAQSRGVPVVSARQMLDWIDGRNDSSFQGVSYGGGELRFTVVPGAGARGLQAMLPTSGPAGPLEGLTRAGSPVSTTARSVKGVQYAAFDAQAGAYLASYATATAPTPPASGVVSPASASPAPRSGAVAHAPALVAPAAGGPEIGRPVARLTIGPKRVRVARDGTVSLRITCPATGRRCHGRLRLRLGRRVIASAVFSVPAGRTRTVRVTMPRPVRRSLARARSLRVGAVTNGTRTTIQLLAPRGA